MSFQSYQEAVEWITGRMSFGIRPGLKRMEWMMEKLGHPERRMRVIHVAGTNGKGSVCAMLTKMLMACGYGVGTFTSPYIETFTNRIQYNAQDIPQDEVLRLANVLKPLSDELERSEWGPPTMFELSTALAVLYFAREAVPYYVVWETGLGGRLDSTNIVHPVISVITNIGHDHTDVLGETMPEIAAEKAGIIKSGVPVVSAVSQPEALAVIEQIASARKSKLYLLDRDFHIDKQDASSEAFDFVGPFRRLTDIQLSLSGDHQLENAAVALMTMDVLRQYNALLADEEEIVPALRQVRWPGRMETIGSNPAILLDGAHNPEGAEALARSIKARYPHHKRRFMLGMLANKNHIEYLKHILPIADTIIATEPDFHKRLPAGQLAQMINDCMEETGEHCDIVVETDWRQALRRLQESATAGKVEDLAVVSGTLYLVSDVRSMLVNGSESEKGW